MLKYGNSFGPFQGSGDEQYKADFFSHWMSLPDGPGGEKEEAE